MDVKEKLVELIESTRYWGSGTSEEIADYLIDNGVTVQEWQMVDLCATCDIPERDYDPSDPEYFCCSDCSCYRCKYLHSCEGQCCNISRLMRSGR